jgi:hypothetical protein
MQCVKSDIMLSVSILGRYEYIVSVSEEFSNVNLLFYVGLKVDVCHPEGMFNERVRERSADWNIFA